MRPEGTEQPVHVCPGTKSQKQLENMMWSLKSMLPHGALLLTSFIPFSFPLCLIKSLSLTVQNTLNFSELQLRTSNNYSSSVFPSHGEHKRRRTDHSFPREAGGHHCGHEIAFHMHQLKWPPHSN